MKVFDIFSANPSCHQGTFLFTELIGWFEMCNVPTRQWPDHLVTPELYYKYSS